MNMIFAETLIAMFGIPIDTVATYQHGWKLGKNLCLATGFLLTTLGWCKMPDFILQKINPEIDEKLAGLFVCAIPGASFSLIFVFSTSS